jgi:hypothetical protein
VVLYLVLLHVHLQEISLLHRDHRLLLDHLL